MLYTIARTLRTPNQPKQWTHQILRTYSYKPVDRPIINVLFKRKNKIPNRPKRQKINHDEYDFDYHRYFVKPQQHRTENEWSMEIIKLVPSTVEELSVSKMLDIFEKLSIVRISDDVLLHENFNTLIDSVKLNESSLSVRQFVNIFMQICNAEVPMFDELNEFIVNILLQRFESFTVDDIIDVDFVIRRYYAREFQLSKLFEELRQMTRASFADKANKELSQVQTYAKLMRMLKYLGNNRSLMKGIYTTRLIELLLLEDDSEFSKNDAAFVIVTLARLPMLNDSSKLLLAKAFRIWCKSAKDTDDVKSILKLLIAKKLDGIDLSPFRNDAFIKHCTKLAVEFANISTAVDILDSFNEMSWTSPDLIEFLSTVFNDNDESQLYGILRPKDYATLCKACEMTNYKPINWDTKMVPAIEKAPIFGIEYEKQIDYALTLNKLGIYQNELIEKLMKSTEVQKLYKHSPKLHEVYRIYGNDDETYANWSRYAIWLKSDLEKFLGPKKVLTNVVINKDVTVPIVMKISTITGEFCDMNANTVKKDLICRANEMIVGIPGCVWTDIADKKHNEITDRQVEQMLKLGWRTINLDENSYGSSSVFRRAFIFSQKIWFAIKEPIKAK